MVDAWGLTNHGRRQFPRALVPNDRNKMADPPIPSGNSVVVGVKRVLPWVAPSQRAQIRLRLICPRFRAHGMLPRHVEYHRIYPRGLLARGLPPVADRATSRRAVRPSRNQLHTRRIISGGKLRRDAAHVKAARLF